MTLDQIRTAAYLYTSTSGTSDFPDATLVALANAALDRVASIIMKSDGRWEWDDENNTDLPIATTALVSGQQDYALTVSHLDIVRAEILDNGTTPQWHKLIPIDQADIYDTALSSFLSSNGLPVYYDKLANSAFLYPIPNYSQSASLKVYFQRPPSYFLTSDTTKTPGFNSLYHDLIPLWIAYKFGLANGKSNVQGLMQEITLREEALREDYALRAKDDHPRLKARPYSWR